MERNHRLTRNPVNMSGMQKISCETLQNFCRGCLQNLKGKRKFKVSNLNLEIRRWLGDITLDNALAHDIYSRSICQSCRDKLKEFLNFYLMCEESKRSVDKLLATGDDNKAWNHNNKEASYSDNIVADEVLELDCYTKISADSIGIDADELLICQPDINALECNNFDNSISQYNRNVHNDSEAQIMKSISPIDNVDINIDYETEIQSEDDISNLNENLQIKRSKKINPKQSKCKTDSKKKYSYLFHCDQCKYRGVSQQYLDIHKRTHSGLKPFQCPRCDESYDKTTILLKHLKTIHGQNELTIICEYEQCGEVFNSSRSYKDHYRLNHLPTQSNRKRDKCLIKSPKKHVCEECGKVYTKLQTFKEHQYTHQSKDFYPFQCEFCDKAFVKSRTFNEHMLRHAGIKNFECIHCGAKKTTRKELREHMNSHTRERQYPCPNCPMIFYRTGNRRVHIDVVHQGIRRFACRYCDQTFGKGDNLKNHELVHTGEKPHACSECEKRFAQKVSLRLHMKTHCK